MGLFDSLTETPQLRKVAYEPEIIIKSQNYKKFELLVDESKWVFATKFMNSLYVYRLPLVKTASFSLITLPLPPHFYALIDAELQKGMFPDLKVTFHLANLNERDGNQSFVKLPAGISNTYKILHALPRTNFTSQTKVVPVSLYLAQTIIHSMMLGNSYNKIIEKTTAMDALKKFENGMTSRFGSQSISFKQLIVSKNKSDYNYENILLKSANDLTIPTVIQTTYKPLNSMSYYFFDDFNINYTPVIGMLRDLSEPLGEPWNIFEDTDKYDISRTLRPKGKIHIADRQEIFKKEFNKASTYIRDSKSKIKVNKNEGTQAKIPNLNVTKETGYIFDAKNTRKTILNNAQIEETNKDNYRHMSIYVPDNIESAQIRNDNFYKFISSLTEALYKFEVYESHIDAIQFDRKYTLDQTDLRSYYVPINIINVFSRINPHESPVSHTSQFQCIKYPGSNTSGNNSIDFSLPSLPGFSLF